MTQEAQYWKQRCEAAEKFIMSTAIMEQVAIEGKDDQRKLLDNWNVLYHTPAPVEGEGVNYPNEYVCGFLFDKQVQQVVLIWKEKPAWQKGKLNGVGGKIEPGETPFQAMVREFKEETGLQVDNWKPLADVNGEDWRVHFFFAQDDKNQFEYAKTMETEEVGKIEVDRLGEFECIPNLYWLVPMAVARIKTPGENIVIGSRWQQGQGNVKCQYCGQMYHGEEPKGCCSGRDCGCMGLPVNGPFVCSKGCYEKLIEGNKPPQPAPTCGARWVDGKQLPDEEGKYLCEKMPITNNETYFERVFFNNGKFQTAHRIVRWLDESPCPFPTREEAIDWVINRYGPGPVDVRVKLACISFFDWLVGQCGKGSVDLVEIAFRRGHQLGYLANQIGESNYENACWDAFKSSHSL